MSFAKWRLFRLGLNVLKCVRVLAINYKIGFQWMKSAQSQVLISNNTGLYKGPKEIISQCTNFNEMYLNKLSVKCRAVYYGFHPSMDKWLRPV